MPLQAGGIARDASQPFTFVTGQGWNVTLTQAQVVLGPLYFNIAFPTTASFRSGVVMSRRPSSSSSTSSIRRSRT